MPTQDFIHTSTRHMSAECLPHSRRLRKTLTLTPPELNELVELLQQSATRWVTGSQSTVFYATLSESLSPEKQERLSSDLRRTGIQDIFGDCLNIYPKRSRILFWNATVDNQPSLIGLRKCNPASFPSRFYSIPVNHRLSVLEEFISALEPVPYRRQQWQLARSLSETLKQLGVPAKVYPVILRADKVETTITPPAC